MKKRIPMEIAIAAFFLIFIVFGVFVCFTNIWIGAISIAISAVIAVAAIVNASIIRKLLSGIVFGTKASLNPEQQSILSSMMIPVLVSDQTEKVLWYNDAFKSQMVPEGQEIFLESVSAIVDGFNPSEHAVTGGRGLYHGSRHYMVFSEPFSRNGNEVFVSFFVEDTVKHTESVEFRKTKPCVMVLNIDNYDELYSSVRSSDRSELAASVSRILDDYINKTNGILLRISSKYYVAVVEEQHMEALIADKFRVLDAVRSIPTGSIPLTLSIGVGRSSRTLYENYINARQALDMALGRGGDQAAVKTRSGYSFYGGVSKAVEKRNKVRSRIMANAIADLFKASGRIIIMGHKMADLDALGSCIGLAKIAEICNVPCKIVFDRNNTMAEILYDELADKGFGKLFITPEDADDYVNSSTLAVVVDCHTHNQLDNPGVLAEAENVIVIDHHRKMVGHIENAVLFYHETSSSSCSEMVTELLQHLLTGDMKLTKLEAEALISGIMLDTKFYSVQTGVRTFDAASYLRTQGAEPAEAKKFFATGLEIYKYKNLLISEAESYNGCAVVVSESLPEGMGLVIPQTADELLNVSGIHAAIVAVKYRGVYRISARSLGEYNVQLIMETLGGGGHQTMAGAQIEGETIEDIRKRIFDAVDKYIETLNS